MQKFQAKFSTKFSGEIFNQIFVGLDREAGSSKLARFGIIKGSATRDRERRRTEANNQQQLYNKKDIEISTYI